MAKILQLLNLNKYFFNSNSYFLKLNNYFYGNLLQKMEDVLQRIKEFRKKKGFSYETMAHELNTSTAAYRKTELNQTKLTLERLYQIAKILEITVGDILDIQANIQLNQSNNENANGYLRQIENFHQENLKKSEKIESLYEARLKDKDLVIEQLQKSMESFSKIIN